MRFVEDGPKGFDSKWDLVDLGCLRTDILDGRIELVERVAFRGGTIRELITDIERECEGSNVREGEAGFVGLEDCPWRVYVIRKDISGERVVLGVVTEYHPRGLVVSGSFIDSGGGYGHFEWNGYDEPNEDEYVKWKIVDHERCRK